MYLYNSVQHLMDKIQPISVAVDMVIDSMCVCVCARACVRVCAHARMSTGMHCRKFVLTVLWFFAL